jgi:polyhydroxyalkanoate synthase subunit PhaC
MGVEEVSYGIDLAGVDVPGLTDALYAAAGTLLKHPDQMIQAVVDVSLAEVGVAARAGRLALGDAVEFPKDRRFADRAWHENPLLYLTAAGYLEFSRTAMRTLERLQLSEPVAPKAEFGLRLLLDAVSPAHVPWLNPRVVKEAYDTGGRSMMRGLATFVDDLLHNRGRPQQVDRSAFVVGRDLAATPGRVVFRNELMELIGYDAQTPQVHAQPVLCSPPWINKYYIMDLAPGRSFIEYAVQNGFQVFTISYRNPDASMAHLTMDDYLRDGLLAALDRVAELTGSDKINLVGLCLGGILATLGTSYLAATGQAERIGWLTITNTLLDFSDPGDLRLFTDEPSIERLERKMAKTGYLEASTLAGTFDWMRGNDLVWNYVVDNWYMGKKPPAFDILAWNADSTNMPAKMHSQYLRACYLRNQLVTPGAFEILGEPVDLSKIGTPMFVLAAETDHITPWPASYRTTHLVSGPVRFVLSNSGHIAGIVNPPGNPKAAYWVGDELPPDPRQWRKLAARHAGSWWVDWLSWAKERSGDLVDPPQLPDGPAAPGSYVLSTAS